MNMNEKMNLACISTGNTFDIYKPGEGAAVRAATTTDDVILFNAVNGCGEKIVDNLNVDIVVSNIIATSVDVHTDTNDEESEMINKPCINFFLADGRMISSISNGIIRAVKKLFEVGFEPTPETPITIKFKEIKTKRGTAHTFDLIKRG